MEHISKLSSILIITILLGITSKTLFIQLSIFLGESFYTLLSTNILIIILLVLIYMNELFSKKNTFNLNIRRIYIGMTVLLVLLAFFIMAFINSGEGLEKFISTLSFYYWIIVGLTLIYIKIDWVDVHLSKKAFTGIILFQCILGISQAILNKPIVNTAIDGVPYVNAIYYLNGSSSSYEYFYNMGAQVRAFGLSDSGLTLGLLALSLGCIYLYKIKTPWSTILLLLSIVTIVLTLTRNVYVTTISCFFIFMVLKRPTKVKISILKIIFMTCIFLGVIFVYIAEDIFHLINNLTFFDLQSTNSRIKGYHETLSLLSNDVNDIIWGHGVTSQDLANYVIDNDFLYIYANAGILIYVITIILYTSILFKGLNGLVNKKYTDPFLIGLITFLSSYPIASILNVVIYVYFPIALISYMFMKQTDKLLKRGY
ncbi:O-antigen ligase family protein [Psychrobacillus sp. MER TA 17]|nr:O-antigen ligase family protein [Psychrobacillus sp. MER TA 17]